MSGIIPFAALTPDNAAILANTAEERIASLRAWGLQWGRARGLHAAIEHLRGVAKAGSYGDTLGALAETGKALQLVTNWLLILNTLTEHVETHVAVELADAIESGASNPGADNVLTQFWFGALLAYSGLKPAVPPPTGRRPDFVVELDTYRISIEVKRPESLHSAIRSVKEAAGQIRDYGRDHGQIPGVVALDLSLALDAAELLTSRYYAPQLPAEYFSPVFMRESRTLIDRIEGQRARRRFARLMGLFVYAEVTAWHSSRTGSPIPSLFLHGATFDRACSGLTTHVANRLRDKIRRGIEDFTGVPVRSL